MDRDFGEASVQLHIPGSRRGRGKGNRRFRLELSLSACFERACVYCASSYPTTADRGLNAWSGKWRRGDSDKCADKFYAVRPLRHALECRRHIHSKGERRFERQSIYQECQFGREHDLVGPPAIQRANGSSVEQFGNCDWPEPKRTQLHLIIESWCALVLQLQEWLTNRAGRFGSDWRWPKSWRSRSVVLPEF